MTDSEQTGESDAIYMIQRGYETGDRYWDWTLDEDYGYFTSRAAAETFIETEFAQERADYAERLRKHEAAARRWETKQQKARSQGFSNPDPYPSQPDEGYRYDVIEVRPGKSIPPEVVSTNE